MKTKASIFLIILLGLGSSLGLGQSTDRSRSSELEQKLRERVTQFYSAIKMNRWEKAANYVISSGKEAFEQQDRGKIHDFKINEIWIDQGDLSARVEVGCVIMASFAGLMSIPRETRWKLVDGEWFYDPTDVQKPLFMRFRESQRAIKAKGKPEVQMEKQSIDFGVVPKGKRISLSFLFINQSPQEIRIEQIYLPKVDNAPGYMTDRTKTMLTKPGEKGEIAVEMNTSDLLREVESTIFVEFQPVNEIYMLKVKGKVFEEKDLVNYKPN